jgi:hypothetical protein
MVVGFAEIIEREETSVAEAYTSSAGDFPLAT